MKVKLWRLGALVAACATAAMAFSAPAASAAVKCSSIAGSGSSLQNTAQLDAYIPGFETSGFSTGMKPCESSPMLEYTATSSGTGLKEWGYNGGTDNPVLGSEKPFPAFVGTDVGPEGPVDTLDSQLNEIVRAGGDANATALSGANKILTVPIAQSAVAVVVSLPKECKPEAPSNEPRVEDGGLEKEWSKNELLATSLVKNIGTFLGTNCGDPPPSLEAREKASGTTAGFKRFIAKVAALNGSNEWVSDVSTAAKAESQSEWPAPSKLHETGNGTGGQLAHTVFLTPNSIGYADLADAVAQGFTNKPTEHTNGSGEKYDSFFTLVENGLGTGGVTFASPSKEPTNLAKAGANCEKATYAEPSGTKDEWNEDWSTATQSNWAAGEGYPICTLTFDLAWQDYALGGLKAKYEEKVAKGVLTYNASDAETANTVRAYLEWVVTTGQAGTSKKTIEEHQYYVLPSGVKAKAEVAPFLEIEG